MGSYVVGYCMLMLLAAAPRDSYVLPFGRGQQFKLLQGYAGPYGHSGHAEFAYDFQMPIGSDVIAARGGKVVKTEQRFRDGTRRPGEENYVIIKHADGSFGRYYHLTMNGVLVKVGQTVKQGDTVGRSGNSGASAGPHLHFDVTASCFDWGCQTIPIRFEGIDSQPLAQGVEYKRAP